MKLRIEDFFLDYLENRLPEARRRRISAALSRSDDLRQELAEFETILRLSGSLAKTAPALSEDLSASVMERIADVEPARESSLWRWLRGDRFWRENVSFVLGVCFAVLVSSLVICMVRPGYEDTRAARMASESGTQPLTATAPRIEAYPVRNHDVRITESLRRSAAMFDDLLSMIGLLLGLLATGLSASLKRYGLACTFLALTAMLFVAVVILPVLAV